MSGDFAGRLRSFMSAKNWPEKIREIVGSWEQSRQSDPAADSGEHRKYNEWPEHAPRRFMNVYLMSVQERLAPEGQETQTEHAERRKQRRQQTKRVKNGPTGLALESGEENSILGEKSREEGNAGDGEGGDQHGPKGPANLLTQPAHAAHVLLASHGVNHAARREEEKRFEECMRHQMENASGERANAACQKHVAQLADCRIRENFLDIRLDEADGRRKERGGASHNRYHQHRRWRMRKNNVRARHNIQARRHHHRRVNQRADRRRPFHGVWQPDVQRQL